MSANARVGVILQARMGSTRLPGKVLKPILGRPMVQWIVERLMRITNATEVCVATSTAPGDRVLVNLLKTMSIPHFVGSETDVLDRMYQCAQARNYDHIVRATADNPLVDPDAGADLIALHLARGSDYSNAFPEQGSGFPRGTGLEVFRFAALETSWNLGLQPHHREHVNEFILENLPRFRYSILEAPLDKRAPHLSLTVDRQEEWEFVEKVCRAYFQTTNRFDVPLSWVVERFGR